MCVCLPPRLLITSGVMWRDMDPMRLVKQVLKLYMATVVAIVNGHVLGIDMRRTHLVSHSQTAFSSFIFGREEKGSGNLT